MPVNNQELLIDHLDATKQGASIAEAEALLASDANAREEWQYLQTAVDAIQYNALHEKVAAIRAEMQPAAVVPIEQRSTRRFIRIAVAAILVFGALTVYKLATVNADKFFNENYSSYTLSTTRGEPAVSPLEQAYRNGNWNDVVTQYNALSTKTNKDHFLAGMASMELKQYPDAIQIFNLVIQNHSDYFQDETEYYLALAYIADRRVEEAGLLLRKMEADNYHLFHQKAKDMLGLDFKILESKY
jgi:hypothetical protein